MGENGREWERVGESGRERERAGESGREWKRVEENGREWERAGEGGREGGRGGIVYEVLSDDKTELFLFSCQGGALKELSIININASVELVKKIRNLGMTFD